MRYLCIGLLILIVVGCSEVSNRVGYPIQLIELNHVKLTGGLLKQYQDTVFTTTIPYAFDQCESTGRIDNFAKAAGLMKGIHIGKRYNDTDVFKILEGACYKLMQVENLALRAYVDSLAYLIQQAQEEDGYLYTARTIDPNSPPPGAGRDRWIDVWVSHELYNAGHLYEAAVAHFKATGDSILINVAIKNADLVCNEFQYGKREIAPGHQGIEIGLIKLYQITGDHKYLAQAQFFLDVRGKEVDHIKHAPGTLFAVYNDRDYLQYHQPVLQQKEAVGHAVRATYMYSGMVDVGQYTGDSAYIKASKLLWNNVINQKTYITGGIGAQHRGESFGQPYELPNASAYNETCAAIGHVFWNSRLFRLDGKSEYYDALTNSLFNGLLSGLALDGKNFFYPNPLESDGRLSRSPWFGVACCPGNLTRFIAEVPSYIYAHSNDTIWINIFSESEAQFIIDGQQVVIEQKTDYPFDGKVDILIHTEKKLDFTLMVRIPQWTSGSLLPGSLYHTINPISEDIQFWVNGKPNACDPGSYHLALSQKWADGNTVILMLPMPVQYIRADSRVHENTNKLAVSRGPLVYCFEAQDQEVPLNDIRINPDITPNSESFSTGIPDIPGISLDGETKTGKSIRLNAIPYFSWNNRGADQMKVWIEEK